MVDTTRQDDQVTLLKPNPDPVIALAPDVKVTCAIENISNLLVLMQMLAKERLDLFLVNVAHLLRADGHLIPVLVVARCSDLVNARDFGNMMIDDAQFLQIVWVDGATRIVG